MNWGPLLATGGDLLFAGGTNDRKIRAFDPKSGEALSEYPARSGAAGRPTSFAGDRGQYVAGGSGRGRDAQRLAEPFGSVVRDHKTVGPQGGTVMCFKLEKE